MSEDSITTRERGERELEHLVAEILDAQDEARRRIADELHDTTAQHLAAVLMGIDHFLASGRVSAMPVMHQARQLVDQSLREIRALCYRLHPPMLDVLGLPPALNWLVRNVQQDSGLAISLHLPADLGRLPPEIETGLFRVAQAELANLQQRADIEYVDLVLTRSASALILTIEVSGGAALHAFDTPTSARMDAGMGGMRARIHQMGGSLRIDARASAARMLIKLPCVEP